MKLFFKVIILDHQGKIAKRKELAIAFFNTDTNNWKRINLEETAFEQGKYTFEYEIPARIYGDEYTLRKIREVVQAGGMPLFRLIDANSEKQEYVLADQITYTMLEEDILCDFKTQYLLQEDTIENFGDPAIPSILITTSTVSDNSNTDIEELQKEITLLKEQLIKAEATSDKQSNTDELVAQIESLHKDINSLKNEQAVFLQEKENLERTINNFNEQNEESQATIDQDISGSAEIENVIETLESEREDLKEQLEVAFQQKEELEANFNKAIQSLVSKLGQNNEIIETLNAEKAALENTITHEVATVSHQREEINNYKNREQEQQSTIEALEVEKQTLRNQIDELSEETIDLEYIPKSVSANKLYTDVIDEIQIAKENTANSGFKLSNISINLKAVAEKDEQGLRFQVIDINNASAINGAAISDIKIDITEEKSATVETNLLAPKLIGLTETAARKYLEKFNLRLDPVYQFINTESSTVSIGQAFRQSPEPGEATLPNATITAIFAKNNQYLN